MIFELAKKLRNNVTAVEMILWGRLKEHFPKLKFRRQHPLCNYIADFYCHQLKLVIEIDGPVHDKEDMKKLDAETQQILESKGIKVIRFTNYDVMNDRENVIEKINILLNAYGIQTSSSSPPL